MKVSDNDIGTNVLWAIMMMFGVLIKPLMGDEESFYDYFAVGVICIGLVGLCPALFALRRVISRRGRKNG